MLQTFIEWLDSTAWHRTFSTVEWIVPAVQTIHIMGVVVVVTALTALSVRLMRTPNDSPTLSEMAGSFLPGIWIALTVLLITGALLIITEPGRELLSTPFWIKMVLVLILTGVTVFMHIRLKGNANYWHDSAGTRSAAIWLGIANIFLFVCIVAAGRLIAYIQHG